jgi:phosphoesterase RecJ-like protein
MITNTPIADIQKLLEAKPRVVVTMHRGPDGDAIGSSLGLYHLLGQMGIESTVIAPDAYPNFLQWLPANDQILVYESQKEAAQKAIDACDLIFCLDFNAPSRLADLEKSVTGAGKPIVVIDHHQEPAEFANYYYVDDAACSTAQMVYRLAEALNVVHLINHDAALGLYTGLVTDTGSFRFPSVTPEVMRMAARLMETGIDHSRIYYEIFDSNSEDQLRLRGYAISDKLVVISELNTAYISLTQEELQRFNFRKGDTEGLVNVALGVKGVHFAAFFSESDGMVKISFRSHGSFDVNQFARRYFDGGGHKNAAGGRFMGKMDKAIALFKEALKAETETILSAI